MFLPVETTLLPNTDQIFSYWMYSFIEYLFFSRIHSISLVFCSSMASSDSRSFWSAPANKKKNNWKTVVRKIFKSLSDSDHVCPMNPISNTHRCGYSLNFVSAVHPTFGFDKIIQHGVGNPYVIKYGTPRTIVTIKYKSKIDKSFK